MLNIIMGDIVNPFPRRQRWIVIMLKWPNDICLRNVGQILKKKKNTFYVQENNKNMKWKFTVIFLCSCIRKDMSYKDEMVKIWRNVKAYFKLIARVE